MAVVPRSEQCPLCDPLRPFRSIPVQLFYVPSLMHGLQVPSLLFCWFSSCLLRVLGGCLLPFLPFLPLTLHTSSRPDLVTDTLCALQDRRILESIRRTCMAKIIAPAPNARQGPALSVSVFQIPPSHDYNPTTLCLPSSSAPCRPNREVSLLPLAWPQNL